MPLSGEHRFCAVIERCQELLLSAAVRAGREEDLENLGSSFAAYALRAVAVLVLSSCAISRQDFPSWLRDSIRERKANNGEGRSRLPPLLQGSYLLYLSSFEPC